MADVEVIIHGPLLDGRAPGLIHAAVQGIQNAVSAEAVNRIHDRLGNVLQHPTGYYESNIITDRSTAKNVVTDNGVVYGPWLEGVGSRNRTTRFKGYFTFRTVTQGLKADAGAIAEEAIGPLMRELL